MSFSFGFGDDDIEADDTEMNDAPKVSASNVTAAVQSQSTPAMETARSWKVEELVCWT